MIKEYFTDGLIGLAILLSLFRTDLVGINDLINYPEVQDVILGQTAAYLPVNFHNYVNSPHVHSNRKLIDFDNQAFSAWYHNVQNLPRYRGRRDTEIEAFLVNVPQPPPRIITGTPFPNETANGNTNGEEAPQIVSPTLPLEGASLFNEAEEQLETAVQVQESENEAQGLDAPTTTVDISFLFSNPFPGCNLTKEDLDLIDVLWRQDVDLGVGKEVYDQTLRQELEKEKELEVLKQQEKERTQALSKEKEERQRKESASRWLRENFMRDGETGEWVRLRNQSLSGPEGVTEDTLVPILEDTTVVTGDTLTLEDFASTIDLNVLNGLELEQQQQQQTSVVAGYPETYLTTTPDLLETQQMGPQGLVAPQPQTSFPHLVQPQDSLEESWNGLVDYLNMTSAETALDNTGNSTAVINSGNNGMLANPEEHLTAAISLNSDLNAMGQEMNTSGDYLLQNATLPAPDGNMTADFGPLQSYLGPASTALTAPGPSTAPTPPSPTEPAGVTMDWGLNDLALFDNLTSGEADLATLTGGADLDLDTVSDMFLNMDAETMLPTNRDLDDYSATPLSGTSSSPQQELSDAFDGLEGAVGGANSSAELCDPFSKVARLSESSNDSGFVYQGGFSSASSSGGSSYAGSPAGSHQGGHPNSSVGHNDTEVDPAGSQATVLARGHVAHNHTYNTPPGQTPREVKKYMSKEPSRKGPQSRDQRRASELKVPFSMSEIIDSPVDTFNEMLTKYKLNEPQLNLIRDIRRRGKNKVAAQNCRKRKVGVIVTLADEMIDLQKMRDRLMAERAKIEQEKRLANEKFGMLYTHIFQSLRDESGQPYDPNLYSLQQASDGNVFLVPRNVSSSNSAVGGDVSDTSGSPQNSSNSSSSEGSGFSRKRRALD